MGGCIGRVPSRDQRPLCPSLTHPNPTLGMLDFNEFMVINDRFPMIFFPAFKIQDTLRKGTLGASRWVGTAHTTITTVHVRISLTPALSMLSHYQPPSFSPPSTLPLSPPPSVVGRVWSPSSIVRRNERRIRTARRPCPSWRTLNSLVKRYQRWYQRW